MRVLTSIASKRRCGARVSADFGRLSNDHSRGLPPPTRQHSARSAISVVRAVSRAARAAARSTPPTTLSGVDAPAVRPMRHADRRAASPCWYCSAPPPTGRWRMRDASTQVRAVDVERRHARRAHARQRLRVAAVVAADDDHHVEVAGVEHRVHGVLAILGRRADRVEGAEVMREAVLADAIAHRGAAACPESPDSRCISIVV